MKRQRGRGRGKPLNQNPNRAYESTGPDAKVRGSAQTILERYQQSGRDAMASGDRILAENFFQHAEHYLRLLKSIQPNFTPRSEAAISGIPNDVDDDMENNDMELEASENASDEIEFTENRNNWRNDRYSDRNNRNDRNSDRNGDRNNNRRRTRDSYRNNRQENAEESVSEQNAEAFEAQPVELNIINEDNDIRAVPVLNDGVVNENDNIENNDIEEKPRQRRVSRLRSPLGTRRPRAPRKPKEETAKAGFGEDMPAFLAASTGIEE